MPTVFSNSSMPAYLLRFHSPRVSAACAGLMWRAAASISATASSAALVMLEVGALTTMTPFCVAAFTSTLSRPDTGAGDDLEPLGGQQRLRVDRGGGAHQDRVDVDDGGEQLGPVGAVAVPDLEVGAEGLHGGGAELFGDEYDGPGHCFGGRGERHNGPDVSDGDLPARRCAPASVTDTAAAAARPAGAEPGVVATPRHRQSGQGRTGSTGTGEGPSKYELLGLSI